MHQVEITSEAYNCLRAWAKPALRKGAPELPNGNRMISLQESTVEHLQHKALEGETFSDTIIRFFHIEKGLN